MVLVRKRNGDLYFLCLDREEPKALLHLEVTHPDRRVLVVERRQGLSILGVMGPAGPSTGCDRPPVPRFAIVGMSLSARVSPGAVAAHAGI